MKRKIRIHHLNPTSGEYTPVFEWETKKKGFTNDVVSYLLNKFRNPSDFPAGYTARPLEKGDRIELVLMEGTLAGRSAVFELVTVNSFRQL